MNSFFCFLCMAAYSFAQVPAEKEGTDLEYTIHTDIQYQVIDNFSASDAWRCDFIGKYWPIEKKERIADLLFKRYGFTVENAVAVGKAALA